MKKWYLVVLALLLQISAIQARTGKVLFAPPLRIPFVLNGGFGELRPTHFHSGIDFKTNGKTGLPVYSIAGGYVSKIFVSYGSGYMLHITHPCGYTSIYRHMIGFTPEIMNYTIQYQYKHMTDQCEITLKPNEIPVKQGSQIGWSGNEGYSMGPHLHLDIYRTDNGDFVDPLPFFMSHFKDTRRPQATSLRLFPQRGLGIVAGRTDPVSFYPASGKTIQAWGWVGVGLKCHDYQDASYSQQGVRYLSFYVDGKLKCATNMGLISRAENKMIFAWVENGYQKMYREFGNRLCLMKTDMQRGLLDVNQERDYKCVLLLKDLYGNQSEYKFTIRGHKKNIPKWKPTGNYLIHWDHINMINRPGLQLIIPRQMVFRDESIHLQVHSVVSGWSDLYQLNNEPLPLLGLCELQIGVHRKVTVQESKKLYIACQSPIGWKSCGGVFHNGYMVTKIDKLGLYKVMQDVTPPRISPISTGRNGRIGFIVSDTESGLRSYRGYVDGRFILLHLRRQSGKMEYKLDTKQVVRGRVHQLELIAVDNVGNIATYKNTFKW
jgi:hypothetical protein